MTNSAKDIRRPQIRRFVEPCLLLLLHDKSSHPYDLIKGLERLTSDREMVDPSVVYRRLQRMEEVGWVESVWVDESLGPPKKVYHLTDEGDRRLARWVEELQELGILLDTFVREYEQHMRTGVGAHH